jgi:aryl-alcohol dehydrogenase-like predicted oxidoreductase
MGLGGYEDDYSSRFGLGAAQFGFDYGVTNSSGQVPQDEVLKILGLAREHGVDLLDTSAAYGVSERVLGDLGTGDFKVVTKLPPLTDGQSVDSSWVIEQMNLSLLRLGRSFAYGLLIHKLEDLRGPNGAKLARGLLLARDIGLVEKVGVSVYDVSDLNWVLEVLKPDIVQAPLNVFDRRLVESGWLEALKAKGVEVHVRSVFLQGTLLTGVPKLPKFLKHWDLEYEEFENWANSQHASLLEAALSYPLSIQGLDKIILGFSSLEELNRVLLSRVIPPVDLPKFNNPDPNHIDPRRWNIK